jgi:methylenetetrahydrofolate reductase (NADPH)
LQGAFQTLGFEVIPFKGTEEAVLRHVPTEVRLTVTASPAKGQDTTLDLAVALAGHGYTVAPHLSARLVRDRAHLADIVARCREAGITGAFVVGGDAAATWFEELSASTQQTIWTSDGDDRFAVLPRPLFPGEDPACPEEIPSG